ncbi:hypothetical protein ACLUEY_11010 [Vreelandella aquamarina]
MNQFANEPVVNEPVVNDRVDALPGLLKAAFFKDGDAKKLAVEPFIVSLVDFTGEAP